MRITICGDGILGWAIATVAHEKGHRAQVLGSPGVDRHDPINFSDTVVMIDASTSTALVGNLRAAVAGGVHRFVVATTGWEAVADEVERILREAEVIAVVAPNLSVGSALLHVLEDSAVRLGPPLGFSRYRGRARCLRGHGSWSGRTEQRLMRTVVLEGPAESIELRWTPRSPMSAAAGALMAVDWLLANNAPGVYTFMTVVEASLPESLRSTTRLRSSI